MSRERRLRAADVVLAAAWQADATATSTGRRAYRIAAEALHALAARMQARADAARARGRKRRGAVEPDQVEPEPDRVDLLSRTAKRDSESWTATRRTKTSVTLRRST